MVLSVKYVGFANVFSPMLVRKLLPHAPHDHAIETGNGQPLFSFIYLLSAVELDVLRKYIENNLEKGFIIPSMSPVETPILFTKKKNKGMRLCVDY